MSEPVRFDAYMDEALYGASGFYVRGGQPGSRAGDFATSVELGSLFAQCVAAYLDRTWHELGQPDPFVVIEGGAGRGTLCLDVLAHVETCSTALQYVMVERVATQREVAEARVGARGVVHPVAAVPDLPSGPLVGVVIANELLDNLPFRLLERSSGGWQEVHVQHNESAAVEEMHPAAADAVSMAAVLAPQAVGGARVPLQLRAAVWMRRALGLLSSGRVLVFDYGVRRTAELAARSPAEWLRTYRSHRRGHDPLHAPGTVDITCEVAFDQLPPGALLVSQADWLTAAGIDELTADARALWQRHRSSPTAVALAARALLEEAAALTDPAGMGAFWAAEWHVD
ncbi:MAG: class I SAM-dependent methyltransferase [Acidimicrobiaceae bacterium]|nr:class I SAM-dependent methyltransferase [Acidimicrobiaceae bacterium]